MASKSPSPRSPRIPPLADVDDVFHHIGAAFGIKPPPRSYVGTLGDMTGTVERHSSYARIVVPCLIVLTVVAVTGLLMWLADVMVPLAMAMFLALLLAPMTDAIRRCCRNAFGDDRLHLWAMSAAVFSLFIAGILIVLVLTILIESVSDASGRVKEYYDYLEQYGELINGTNNNSDDLGLSENGVVASILRIPGVKDSLKAVLSAPVLTSLVGNVLGSVSLLLGNGAIVFFCVMYILYTRGILQGQLDSSYQTKTEQAGGPAPIGISLWLLWSIEKKSIAYFKQKTLASLLQGVLCAAVYRAVDAPLCYSFGVVHFFANWIQIAGPVAACILPIPVVLVSCDCVHKPLIAIFLPGIIHLVIANVLEPKLMKSLLSPVEMIAALIFWYKIWGLGGLVLAVPITNALKMFVMNDLSEWHPDDIEAPAGTRPASRVSGYGAADETAAPVVQAPLA